MRCCLVVLSVAIAAELTSPLGNIRPSVDGLCRDGPSEISRDRCKTASNST